MSSRAAELEWECVWLRERERHNNEDDYFPQPRTVCPINIGWTFVKILLAQLLSTCLAKTVELPSIRSDKEPCTWFGFESQSEKQPCDKMSFCYNYVAKYAAKANNVSEPTNETLAAQREQFKMLKTKNLLQTHNSGNSLMLLAHVSMSIPIHSN